MIRAAYKRDFGDLARRPEIALTYQTPVVSWRSKKGYCVCAMPGKVVKPCALDLDSDVPVCIKLSFRLPPLPIERPLSTPESS